MTFPQIIRRWRRIRELHPPDWLVYAQLIFFAIACHGSYAMFFTMAQYAFGRCWPWLFLVNFLLVGMENKSRLHRARHVRRWLLVDDRNGHALYKAARRAHFRRWMAGD